MKKCEKCYCRGDCGECKNTTGDLIHRDRAIQAIKEIFPPPSETGAWNTALAVAAKAIEGLPSASNAGNDNDGWEMFSLITSTYYGKAYYFLQDDGLVYSRASHKYMTEDAAISEFLGAIGE